MLGAGFDDAFRIASAARAKGYDPEDFVEIKPAPDLASRVDGIIGIPGLEEIIRAHADIKSRQELAFIISKEVCQGDRFKDKSVSERLTIAVKVGLAVLTEGVVVASTEGIQKVELHRNPDGSDYAAVVYAGPIRGAGGTDAAMSVALADFSRRLLGIGPYKPQQTEVERTLEEILIYHSRIARLQYMPSEQDIKHILSNCPVCVDGMPTENMEVSVHRNMKRLNAEGVEEPLTNRVRGGIGLVVCEGIAQKAKSVLEHTKNAGLDWSWLNTVIKVAKQSKESTDQKDKSASTFLQDLVAGRPILSYPEMRGSFRLRYGRSRMTGIAAKGFSPATMVLLGGFIAIGTQLRIEKPGKGCIATPVDTIEGPFVKLRDGRAIRVNTAEVAEKVKNDVVKIISVGDLLATYGDFKKSNTKLVPSGYVEEYWGAQLAAAGGRWDPHAKPTFKEAYDISLKYNMPMHPSYIYEYSDIEPDALTKLRDSVANAKFAPADAPLHSIESIELQKSGQTISALERLCVPHVEAENTVVIRGDDAKSIVVSLGLVESDLILRVPKSEMQGSSPLEMINSVSPFKIMLRSTRVGARIGRPEKAKERLMKPAPNVLFPVGEYGGKERNISKAYLLAKKRFSNKGIETEIARYRCQKSGELIYTRYCHVHGSKANLEYTCKTCGRVITGAKCGSCGGDGTAGAIRMFDITDELEKAMGRIGSTVFPKLMKGVKGLASQGKFAEPLEKGILRANAGIHIFKDGTARFDATDAPITHFYPVEMGISVEEAKKMGYVKDYKGNELVSETQLLELRHQDVILSRDGAEFMLKVAKFIDELLVKYYHMDPFYNITSTKGLLGHMVVTLSPHTSAGVLCRIVGFTDAHVGFAHPYVICARRRNCDGDEDTTMLLLDALINFSKRYLPSTIGGTMDAPLIGRVTIDLTEVDNEVHAMEAVESYGLEFYGCAERKMMPGEAKVGTVKDRIGGGDEYEHIWFTHDSGPGAIAGSPKSSTYTTLNTMSEKIDAQFRLTDMLECVDRPDSAKRLILSHFIPDLIGNMHSYSKQQFRCVACNAKYRRVPLVGKCTRCAGKIVLTISKSSIEKYLETAIGLAERYSLEPYIRQRLFLVKDEIENVFGFVGEAEDKKQFSLTKFL